MRTRTKRWWRRLKHLKFLRLSLSDINQLLIFFILFIILFFQFRPKRYLSSKSLFQLFLRFFKLLNSFFTSLQFFQVIIKLILQDSNSLLTLLKFLFRVPKLLFRLDLDSFLQITQHIIIIILKLFLQLSHIRFMFLNTNNLDFIISTFLRTD